MRGFAVCTHCAHLLFFFFLQVCVFLRHVRVREFVRTFVRACVNRAGLLRVQVCLHLCVRMFVY